MDISCTRGVYARRRPAETPAIVAILASPAAEIARASASLAHCLHLHLLPDCRLPAEKEIQMARNIILGALALLAAFILARTVPDAWRYAKISRM